MFCYVMLCYVMLWYACIVMVCMYVGRQVGMHVCIYVCMYVCMYVCVYIYMGKSNGDRSQDLGFLHACFNHLKPRLHWNDGQIEGNHPEMSRQNHPVVIPSGKRLHN